MEVIIDLDKAQDDASDDTEDDKHNHNAQFGLACKICLRARMLKK